MKAFDRLKAVLSEQLFAKIPEPLSKSFSEEVFSQNLLRFSAQCFVLVVMDALYLLGGLLLGGRASDFNGAFAAILAVRVALMAGGFFYFARLSGRVKREDKWFYSHVDFLYPLIHMALELMLFLHGPQDLGAVIRLSAVPFIVGGIPIIRQRRTIVLELITFFAIYACLPGTEYGQYIHLPVTVIQIWLVTLPSAVFVSFLIYSAKVRNYVLDVHAQNAQLELKRMAHEDELTKISNRRDLIHYLDETWSIKDGDHHSLSVIMIDIDHFKMLNDRYGHPVGDHCLSRVASALREEIGPEYRFARYGGEEFILVGYDVRHKQAVALAERLRERVMSLQIDNPDSDVAPYITASFGVATQKVQAISHYDTIIQWADECLYYAKNAGRNRVAHVEDRRNKLRLNEALNPLSVGDRYRLSGGDMGDMRSHSGDFCVECSFVYYVKKRSLTLSDAAMKLLGYPKTITSLDRDTIKKYLNLHPDDAEQLVHKVDRCIAAHAPFMKYEFRVRLSDQREVWMAAQAKCIYAADDQLEVIYGAVFDIEGLERYQYFLRENLSLHPVTLLKGREYLGDRLREMLIKPGNRGLLLMVDIDDFRAINGFYGFEAGNAALKAVAENLSQYVEPTEGPYHFKTDQFILILPNDDGRQAEEVARKVHEHFKGTPVMMDHNRFTVPFAITSVRYATGMTLDALFADLDIANRLVKENPKNAAARLYSPYTDQMRDDFLKRVRLEAELINAVEHDFRGFALHYQPIFDMSEKVLAGAEALLRWSDEQGQIIPPALVVPILERTGRMPEVECWIIDRACRQCAIFIENGFREDFIININLSTAFISRASLIGEVLESVKRYGLNLHNIFLEVTESFAAMDNEAILRTLNQLRVEGLRIAIDDFGTGYSSLSYLRSLPADEIKVDRSFVPNGEVGDTSSKDFLNSIVSLAKSRDLKVCLEGLETRAQCEAVSEMSIDFLQGFYLGKPCSPEDFSERFGPKCNEA